MSSMILINYFLKKPFTSTPITLQLQVLFLEMLINNYITVTVIIF